MATSGDGNSEKATMPIPSSAPGDAVENQTPSVGAGVSNIVWRWRREDLMKKSSLASRGLGLIFSALAFVIMASNKHGDWKNFDRYEEYRYVLAIAILSTLYTGLQTLRQVHELSTGKEIFSRQNVAVLDFIGDQLIAYLLLSAASSAVPLTNRMRENNDNIFTDTSTSAISMEFLAFLSIAISSLLSGYKLSRQTYI